MAAFRSLARRIVDDERGMSGLERFGLSAAVLSVLIFIPAVRSVFGELFDATLGQVDDVTRCVTSDLKRAGSKLVLVGQTHLDPIPQVRPGAPQVMREVAAAIRAGRVRACHDLAEGGLAVAATEMAIGGGLGVRIETDTDLFNESPSRFLLEVDEDPGAFFLWETVL